MKSKLDSQLSVFPQSSSPWGNRIVQLWAKRYIPNLSMLRLETKPVDLCELDQVASPSGRAKTVAKLERLLLNNCEFAGIRTNALFTYIPKIVNLTQAREISPCVAQIYEKTFSVYLQQSPPLSSLLARPIATNSNSSTGTVNFSMEVYKEWSEPILAQLVIVLEPLLGNLRKRLMLAPDPRTLGFMSTQFHLTTKLLLEKLTPCEQVLLGPYFKFVEEQVSIPWQRVCVAATQYSPNSPIIKIVDQLLPVTQEIAYIAYARATQVYSDHRSRRGDLKEVGVMNSTIRDLEMFQVYLLLCFLEENMTAIEQDLLPMCVRVFPSVGVTSELVRQMLRFLVNEIMSRLEPAKSSLLFSYTDALQEMFSDFDKNVNEFSKDSRNRASKGASLVQ